MERSTSRKAWGIGRLLVNSDKKLSICDGSITRIMAMKVKVIPQVVA